MIFQGATIVDQQVCISGWGICADDSNIWSNTPWNYENNSMVCIDFLPKSIYSGQSHLCLGVQFFIKHFLGKEKKLFSSCRSYFFQICKNNFFQ